MLFGDVRNMTQTGLYGQVTRSIDPAKTISQGTMTGRIRTGKTAPKAGLVATSVSHKLQQKTGRGAHRLWDYDQRYLFQRPHTITRRVNINTIYYISTKMTHDRVTEISYI